MMTSTASARALSEFTAAGSAPAATLAERLRALAIGDSLLLPYKPYAHSAHALAASAGIRVSTKKQEGDQVLVTRIAPKRAVRTTGIRQALLALEPGVATPLPFSHATVKKAIRYGGMQISYQKQGGKWLYTKQPIASTNGFQLEKGIPVPERKGVGITAFMEQMEPGDSVLLDKGTANVAMSQANKRFPNARFCSRVQSDGQYRLWRIS